MDDAGAAKADQADRLEAALERIASSRAQKAGDPGAASDLASRLDALIAELRSVLGRDSAI